MVKNFLVVLIGFFPNYFHEYKIVFDFHLNYHSSNVVQVFNLIEIYEFCLNSVSRRYKRSIDTVVFCKNYLFSEV